MNKTINCSEHHLAKIFSSDFKFHIPHYQRPYAWGEEQATELFDDLFAFYEEKNEDDYLLGSIVLIKKEKESRAEVIDGQQRLTTLTILLATIASHVDDEDQKELKAYIIEKGKKFEKIQPSPRLFLRNQDQEFFRKYIQDIDIEALKDLDRAKLNEVERNICNNAKILHSKIQQKFFSNKNALMEFAEFILNRCVLIAISTPSQKSAFRIFSVINSRGLDLQPTDMIKAEIIGKIPEKDREDYSEKWEQIESSLGRNQFNDLFVYIRMIYVRKKAKRSLLEEFNEYVTPKFKPDKLIDELLEPYADSLGIILNANYASEANAENINEYLKWFGRIDNTDWVPPVIHFLKKFGTDSEPTLQFLKSFERLLAYIHIFGKNVNKRIERYGKIIDDIEKSENGADLQRLNLENDEINKMKDVLNGDIYNLHSNRRQYLILRLDSFISDQAAVYNSKILTIEHVLPQDTNAEDWLEIWPDATVWEEWVHKLANLVPLNKRKNSKAQNYAFKKKCEIYFSGTNASSYALTSQVLQKDTWDIEIVEKRQKELLQILYDKWDLN